ncbi:TPA: hypothetical protein OMP85_003430 [Acinetobacter baumannii]|nr:hypothetical protein [Acinetobacter baumannii]
MKFPNGAFTLAEAVEYCRLKQKFDPECTEQGLSEWLGAEIAIPADVALSEECEDQEIDIHILGKRSSSYVLTLNEAKEFLEQLLDAVRAFEPDYMFDKNQDSTAQNTLDIEPLSLLPS